MLACKILTDLPAYDFAFSGMMRLRYRFLPSLWYYLLRLFWRPMDRFNQVSVRV
jgi:hypothetical protein